jgi:hypothetical protein
VKKNPRSVHQPDLGEFYGDDTALLERGAKDIQVVPADSPTDTQNDTLFGRKSVDPAGHPRVACRDAYGKRDANEGLTESGAKLRYPIESASRESGKSGGCGESGEMWHCSPAFRSEELELGLVDVQRLDAMVERDGGIPSFAAAPEGPATQPRHTASAASIISRSARRSP